MKYIIILVILFSCSVSHADNKSLISQVPELIEEFRDMRAEIHIIYKMTSKLFIKRFGYSEYEKLIWGEHDKGQTSTDRIGDSSE